MEMGSTLRPDVAIVHEAAPVFGRRFPRAGLSMPCLLQRVLEILGYDAPECDGATGRSLPDPVN